jgi:threonine/homoserine/homoserine lactone efflux protein
MSLTPFFMRRRAARARIAVNVSGTQVNAAVAWLAGSARRLLDSRGGRAWFQRASGAVLTARGLRLALAR